MSRRVALWSAMVACRGDGKQIETSEEDLLTISGLQSKVDELRSERTKLLRKIQGLEEAFLDDD